MFKKLKHFLSIFYPKNIRNVIVRIYMFSQSDPSSFGRTNHLNEIIKKNNYKSFVEVGIWQGENILTLAFKNQNVKFYGVDPLSSESYGTNEKKDDKQEKLLTESKNIKKSLFEAEKSHRNFKFINKFSSDAAMDFEDESIDVVFIDALHTHEAVLNDINSWLPKVKKGGYLSGHDYSLTFFGVVLAVNELLGVDNIEIRSDATWFYYKK